MVVYHDNPVLMYVSHICFIVLITSVTLAIVMGLVNHFFKMEKKLSRKVYDRLEAFYCVGLIFFGMFVNLIIALPTSYLGIHMEKNNLKQVFSQQYGVHVNKISNNTDDHGLYVINLTTKDGQNHTCRLAQSHYKSWFNTAVVADRITCDVPVDQVLGK